MRKPTKLKPGMNIYIIRKPKDKAEWLSERGIGGSSASSILNLNPWQSPFDLYCELVGKSKPKDIDNDAIRLGVKLEPIIRKQVSIYLKDKYKVQNPPKNNWVYIRKDKPFMTASLDGVLIDRKNGERGVLEIKTHLIRNRKDAETWESGTLPQNYFVQVCHYLNVTGWKYAVLVANLQYNNFDYDTKVSTLDKVEQKYYYLFRDEMKDDLAYEEEQVTDFWENHVMKKIPPELNLFTKNN